MKKSASLAALLVALPVSFAVAADLPSRKEPVIAPAVVPSWTGFHVGLNAGGTWGAGGATNMSTWPALLTTTGVRPVTGEANYRNSLYNWALPSALGVANSLTPNGGGFIGGGQVGYDWQATFGGRSFVTGVEADIQGVASSGNTATGTRVTAVGGTAISDSTGAPIATVTSVSKSLDYLGTVRGRVGYLATPEIMIYGTGGLAYGGARISSSTVSYAPTISPSSDLTYAWGSSGSSSNTQVGWTAGGGAEWMFLPNWSLKGEYLYYDLGKVTYNQGLSGAYVTANSAVPGNYSAGQPWWGNMSQVSTRFNGNIVRLGVNYHFNFATAPVVAKF
jgi:outer membrane immunogenic protein